MGRAATKTMTVEEFFEWQKRQENLYELVEGVPVLYRGIEMMSGGSGTHDRVITNLIIAIGTQLGDGPCRPATADYAIRTKIKSLRRADVLITCDEVRPDVFESLDPRAVIEVLSPKNTGVAWQRKLDEYRRHAKLDYILLVDSRVWDVKLYTRTRKGWDEQDFGPEDAVQFAKLDCSIAIATIYNRTGLKA